MDNLQICFKNPYGYVVREDGKMVEERHIEQVMQMIRKQKFNYVVTQNHEMNEIIYERVKEEFPDATVVRYIHGQYVAVTKMAKRKLKRHLRILKKDGFTKEAHDELLELLNSIVWEEEKKKEEIQKKEGKRKK